MSGRCLAYAATERQHTWRKAACAEVESPQCTLPCEHPSPSVLPRFEAGTRGRACDFAAFSEAGPSVLSHYSQAGAEAGPSVPCSTLRRGPVSTFAATVL
eukprot:5457-Rhodomonas_salina.9